MGVPNLGANQPAGGETPPQGQENRSAGEQASGAATPAAPSDLEQRYAELEKFAKSAVDRAERAESYQSQMLASLQTAAETAARGNQPQVDIRERFAEDPVAVLDEHFQARTAPIVGAVAENNARINRELAFVKFGNERIPGTEKTLADVYGKAVDEFLNNLPPQTRAQAGAYEAAMQWVRSQHIDDEIKLRMEGERERQNRAFMESPTSVGGNAGAKKTLSDIERTVAKGLGLTDEDYLKWRDEPGA